jgi:predicted kinase
MATLTMMVGVSGSGKSTVAQRIAEETGAYIASSDAIRGQIYGDENCQANHARVFEILHKDILHRLKAGQDCVYDATNLSCKRRMAYLKTLAHLDITKRCVVVITTPEDIKERMEKRERKVPMEVVHRHIEQFQCPNFYEGWDDIQVEFNSDHWSCHESWKKLWLQCEMPHDNHHHSLDIDEHMFKAGIHAAADGRGDSVMDGWVARTHDLGKGVTKVFRDRDGNPTKEAHYYNHQNVGAYYSLIHSCCDFDQDLGYMLDDACLIQWHMEHYLRKGPALDKFYKMIGPELERRLHILEDADKAAH